MRDQGAAQCTLAASSTSRKGMCVTQCTAAHSRITVDMLARRSAHHALPALREARISRTLRQGQRIQSGRVSGRCTNAGLALRWRSTVQVARAHPVQTPHWHCGQVPPLILALTASVQLHCQPAQPRPA